MKSPEYLGDKLYKDLSYIFNYYNIFHKRQKKGKEIFLMYYGYIYSKIGRMQSWIFVPEKYKYTERWLVYYCLILIREGVCPIAGFNNNKAITLSGPCDNKDFWAPGRDLERGRERLIRNYGRAYSKFNYGTNSNWHYQLKE